MNSSRRILICPLEWGLGHAGRMIPLAERLRELGNEVIFAAGEKHLAFIRTELPFAETVIFPGFRPRYSRWLPQYLAMLLKTPALIFHTIREHYRLKGIIKECRIDIVISDNRFGLWNRNVRTVYVTHQPLIPLPKALRFLEPAGKMLHFWIIRKYDFCFIPDLPGDTNLSGRLTHGFDLPLNVRFIGILSRFVSSGCEETRLSSDPDYRNVVILSGPEPQRSILKEKLAALLKKRDEKSLFLEGRPEDGNISATSGKLTFIKHPDRETMAGLIRSCRNIITRPGYTSVMELASLGRSALLVPTPGQTEQEYLAEYLSGKGWFVTAPQSELNDDLKISGDAVRNLPDLVNESKILLDKALAGLLLKE